jgi:hypothetical protein
MSRIRRAPLEKEEEKKQTKPERQARATAT